MGDDLLVEFANAVEIQRGMAKRNAGRPDKFVAIEDDVTLMGRTSPQIKSSGGIENRRAHFIRVRDSEWARFVGHDTAPLLA
jgi:hypothetical protein